MRQNHSDACRCEEALRGGAPLSIAVADQQFTREHAIDIVGQPARRLDDERLGLDGVSKSEVSRICAELDPLVEAFRTRALTTDYPYIWWSTRRTTWCGSMDA